MSFKCLLLLSTLALMSLSVDPRLRQHILPVHGNASFGYYYVNLYIGTPPQQQSVIISTASEQLALPCSECVSCGTQHIHRPLDIRKSSTNKIITCDSGNDLCKESCRTNQPQPCTFLNSYVEGSQLSGVYIEDTIQFQNREPGEAIVTTFGCTIRQTNLFYTQAANGIFGLAPQRKTKLFELLYEKHSKYTGEQLLFSICLSENGGQMIIGKISKQLTAGIESVKTKFSPNRNLYSLNNVGPITFNGTVIRQSQDLGFYGMFIDSGSTLTYFPTRYYNILLQNIQNICALHSVIYKKTNKTEVFCLYIDLPQNQSIKDVLISIFPSIDIQINGKIVSWSPHCYFLLSNNTQQICLGVLGLDRFLLGSNWMVDRNIVFNLKQQTIEIYSDVQCSALNQVQKGIGISLLVLIALLLIVMLLLIGFYYFYKQKKKREIRNMQNIQADNAIVFAQNQNSSIGIEEKQESKIEESNEANTNVKVN